MLCFLRTKHVFDSEQACTSEHASTIPPVCLSCGISLRPHPSRENVAHTRIKWFEHHLGSSQTRFETMNFILWESSWRPAIHLHLTCTSYTRCYWRTATVPVTMRATVMSKCRVRYVFVPEMMAYCSSGCICLFQQIHASHS